MIFLHKKRKEREKMNETNDLKQKLYEKLEQEYYDFIEELKIMPPEQIIAHSYEKVFKEDILMCFEESDLDYEKTKALCELEKPLDLLYDEWLSTDDSYMEMLRDCIDRFADNELAYREENEMER